MCNHSVDQQVDSHCVDITDNEEVIGGNSNTGCHNSRNDVETSDDRRKRRRDDVLTHNGLVNSPAIYATRSSVTMTTTISTDTKSLNKVSTATAAVTSVTTLVKTTATTTTTTSRPVDNVTTGRPVDNVTTANNSITVMDNVVNEMNNLSLTNSTMVTTAHTTSTSTSVVSSNVISNGHSTSSSTATITTQAGVGQTSHAYCVSGPLCTTAPSGMFVCVFVLL